MFTKDELVSARSTPEFSDWAAKVQRVLNALNWEPKTLVPNANNMADLFLGGATPDSIASSYITTGQAWKQA